MNSAQIKQQIDICYADESLSDEQKNLKLHILTVALQMANAQQMYNKHVISYRRQGLKLEKITNGNFKLDSSIIITESRLRNYLNNSKIGIYLQAKGIKTCSFDEILAHANLLQDTDPNFDIKEVETALSCYENLEKIGKAEKEVIDTIAVGLGEIIGGQIMDETKKMLLVSYGSGEAKIKLEEKTYDEIQSDHVKALNAIKTLKEKLSEQEYKYVISMINRAFEYYEKGNKEISLPSETKVI